MHRTDIENELLHYLGSTEMDYRKFLVLQQLINEGWNLEEALEELEDVHDSLALELIHKGMTKSEAFRELDLIAD